MKPEKSTARPPVAPIHPAVAALVARLRGGPLTRFVAFGSSNTERASHAERFLRFMEVVREAAHATGSALVDNLVCWERLRQRDVAAYREQGLALQQRIDDLGESLPAERGATTAKNAKGREKKGRSPDPS
jgi:hypothetical protein